MKMVQWCCHLCLTTLLTVLGLQIKVGQCIRDVRLRVEPPAVKIGGSAALICEYDLENAPLYSVKLYRGQREFYRFSPSETPPTKIFPFQGIHVDLSSSNENKVVLRKIGFNLSGNFSCEVTADAPSFSSAVVHEHMLVAALPKRPPVIHTEMERYDPGDILRANCTSSPSKPAAGLSFLLNNIPVGRPETREYHLNETLQWSMLPLTVQVSNIHYSDGYLSLKCTAYVTPLFRETTEKIMELRTREPIPEKVMSSNLSSTPELHLSFLFLTVLGIICWR